MRLLRRRALILFASGTAVLTMAACGSAEETRTTHTAPRPTISDAKAEMLWRSYFKDAANTGKSPAEGEETTCEPEGDSWVCTGVAAYPSEDQCWMESGDITSAGQIKAASIKAHTLEMNPPGDPAGRCKI